MHFQTNSQQQQAAVTASVTKTAVSNGAMSMEEQQMTNGGVRLRLPHEFKGSPVSMPPPETDYQAEKLNLPEINLEPKKIVVQQQQQV